jgi:hypothetical protein
MIHSAVVVGDNKKANEDDEYMLSDVEVVDDEKNIIEQPKKNYTNK